MGFWPVVLNVLKNADVVLLLLDARVPDLTLNSEIVKKVEAMPGKRLVLVFNKSDLVNKKELERLKEHNFGAYFISGVKKQGVRELKAYLDNLADNFIEPSLRVGIVGYPNVGKSTLINLLAPHAKAKVSNVSGTTKKTQWIRVGRLRIMDSPGVIPSSDKSISLGLTSAKDPQKIKHPERVAIELISRLRKHHKNTLESFYSVSAESDNELFFAIGKKKGYLLKGGEIDERRTALKILEDWQRGKIGLK